MKSARFFLLIASVLFLGTDAFAQTEKKVVVEHFTNTRCSICGSRNPSLRQNLENFPELIYISYHPSAPYSSCIFNQHNPSENDGRTSFYNIYGATPRLVIQGEVQSGSVDFGNANLFSSQLNLTTPFSIYVREIRKGEDSVSVEITVKAVSTHSEANASLFAGYVEGTIDYNAPNGEQEHHNVFRQAFSPVEGAAISLPAAGDSVTWTSTIAIRPEWNMAEMKVVAILQDQLSLVLQSGTTDMVEQSSTGIEDGQVRAFQLYPNPAIDRMTISGVTGTYRVLSCDGREMVRGETTPLGEDFHIRVGEWPAGLYVMQANGGAATFLVE